MACKVRVPVSPWDTQAGQGEWGRHCQQSASSAPSKRGELCTTVTHRVAHGNEEGGSGQLAAFVLFTTHYKSVLI